MAGPDPSSPEVPAPPTEVAPGPASAWPEAWNGTKAGRFARDIYQGAVGLVHSFRGDSITLRAGNLTFITITSLLPLLAVVLSLLHVFQQRTFEARVLSFVQDVLAPGHQAQGDNYVQQFFTLAGSRAAGGVSFAVLLVSAGLLLRHLDASLNEIWAVRRRRPLLVSLGLYTALLLFGPTVVGLSLTMSTSVRGIITSNAVPFAAQLILVGSMTAAMTVMTMLYKLAPHAPVRWRSALAGGVVAGLGWELARHLYGGIALLFFSANPVYGTLGIAPLFLMWLYLSWCLVLFGARLSYAVEHASFRGRHLDVLAHPRSRELIAARIAQLVTRAVRAKALPPTALTIAATCAMPGQLVQDVVHQLELAGLLSVGKRGELAPAKDPASLTLAQVSAAVGGVRLRPASASKEFGQLEAVLGAADAQKFEHLERLTWVDLAERSDGG